MARVRSMLLCLGAVSALLLVYAWPRYTDLVSSTLEHVLPRKEQASANISKAGSAKQPLTISIPAVHTEHASTNISKAAGSAKQPLKNSTLPAVQTAHASTNISKAGTNTAKQPPKNLTLPAVRTGQASTNISKAGSAKQPPKIFTLSAVHTEQASNNISNAGTHTAKQPPKNSTLPAVRTEQTSANISKAGSAKQPLKISTPAVHPEHASTNISKAAGSAKQPLKNSTLPAVHTAQASTNISKAGTNTAKHPLKNLTLPAVRTEKPVVAAGPPSEKPVCKNVLTDTLIGHWEPRQVTEAEKIAVNNFYITARRPHKIPLNLQRNDSRCGVGVTYPGAAGWFRALCDPYGPTPCCYNHTCVNRTIQQCTCDVCHDYRQLVYAELAKWQPENPACDLPPMSVQESCHVLRNTTLIFIGDSLMRHVYTAFTMRVTGDLLAGALKGNTPPGLRKNCSGMYMFTEKVCRGWLIPDRWLCNGTTRVRYVGYTGQVKQPERLLQLLKDYAKDNRVLVVLNFALHVHLSVPKGRGDLLWLFNRTKWFHRKPEHCGTSRSKTSEVCYRQLLWMTPHMPGLLKEGWWIQGKQNVVKFNTGVGELLSEWKVPVLDTSRVTYNVVSQDGTHYGSAVNDAIIRTLLRYAQSLHTSV